VFVALGIIEATISRFIEPSFFKHRPEVWGGAELPDRPMEAEVPSAVFDEARIDPDAIGKTRPPDDHTK
jgi:hypothetical protein